MSGVVYACVTPHGHEVIPELARAAGGSAPEDFASTREAMEEAGRRLRRADPDVVVLASPHNLRLDGGYTAVVTADNLAGRLESGEAVVEARFPGDREWSGRLLARARSEGIPVVGANFGGLEGPTSEMALDWGSVIPLYFIGERQASASERVVVGPRPGGRPRVVVIGPSRQVPPAVLVRLGELVAEVAAETGTRVAFVASADQAHAHRADGPYGYHPAAAVYDELVKAVVAEGRLGDLLAFDPALVEAAKPDAYWQMLLLSGVLRVVPLRGELLAYQVPRYYGMLTASYDPA